MQRFAEAFEQGQLILADGAWGSNLIAAGLNPQQDIAEHWNVRRPKQVATLATAFVEAGAQVLTTNTFGANRIRLARFGLDTHLDEINRRGVELIQAVARPTSIIVASMGPTGLKDISGNAAEISRSFREQAQILTDAGANALLLETMTSPEEAQIAITQLKQVSTLPILCSFAFTREFHRDFTTWSGATVDTAIRAALDAGADMVGANCIPADEYLLSLLDSIKTCAPNQPLWLKPNAGTPIPREGAPTYPSPIHESMMTADALSHRNVVVIGGCCGTTPSHISHLSAHPGLQESGAPNAKGT